MKLKYIMLIMTVTYFLLSTTSFAQIPEEILISVEKEMQLKEIERIRQLEFIDVPRTTSILRPLHTSDKLQRELRAGAIHLAKTLTNVLDGISIEKKYDWIEARDGRMPVCEIENERDLIYRGGGPCHTTTAWTIKANPNKYFGLNGIQKEINELVKHSSNINRTIDWGAVNRSVQNLYLESGIYGINIFFDEAKPSELQVIVAW